MLKKISITILIISLILILNIFLFQFYKEKYLIITKTYISTHDIKPRQKIKEEDLTEINVPYKYINNDVFNTKEEIIGKYTDINGKIPKGSLFYKSMLFDEKELPDNPSLKLKDNQVSFSLPIDLSSLSGNTIIENQRVDIYGTINNKSQIIQDLLISNVRIISIKDSKGYNLDNPNSNKIPFIINIAINEDDLKYIYYISSVGKINIFANSKSYDTELEAKLFNESKLIEFYKQNSETSEED